MKKLFLITLMLLIGVSLFIWSGAYNIAANDEHWEITNELIEVLRERSIEVRAEDTRVPENLVKTACMTTAGIKSVAVNYDEMCVSCHLAPGIKTTELHEGLYPQPPVLHDSDHAMNDDRRNFWIIKNGIKLTGMPAWGASHDDEAIWALVAFIKDLTNITAEEYEIMTASSSMKNSRH